MSAPPALLVFVDALPYAQRDRFARLAAWPVAAPLTPGLGYSINIHAELYAGANPDQVGFFGEWTLAPEVAPGRRYARLLPWLDRLLRPYLLNRGLQTVLTVGYRPGQPMPNIPLARLADFGSTGVKVGAADFPVPTIFSRHSHLMAASGTGLAKGRRDPALVGRARQLIESGARHVFVALPDLDGIGHTAATGSRRWLDHLTFLDQAVDDLSDLFLTAHPDGGVYVFSDHGMADVRRSVPFEPEPALGLQSRNTYLAFTDSTILRVWLRRPELASRLDALLEATDGLTLLSDQERRRFGVTNPAFGDRIAVLAEGLCFEPSTFARHRPAAMHGYHPDVPSQTAAFLHRGRTVPEIPATTRQVFGVLDQALAN